MFRGFSLIDLCLIGLCLISMGQAALLLLPPDSGRWFLRSVAKFAVLDGAVWLGLGVLGLALEAA